jgi:hypothetical protein
LIRTRIDRGSRLEKPIDDGSPVSAARSALDRKIGDERRATIKVTD